MAARRRAERPTGAQINAKFRYVSDVRKLKTYGITSFEVLQKEEGKKKPIVKRLGVTRDAILILDGETRVRRRRAATESGSPRACVCACTRLD